MGVEVRLNHAVEQIDAEGVTIAGERIRTPNVIWAAGARATPVGKWLDVETDGSGRIKVNPNLTVPGHPEIFVVGDAALILQDEKPLPGLAPVAIQSGRYAGRAILKRVAGETFKYFDKGSLATIERNYAILEWGRLRLTRFSAKILWAFIHIFYLMQNEDRLVVFLKWTYDYFTKKRGTRLIEEK
jgi:NADH dehydrogenase